MCTFKEVGRRRLQTAGDEVLTYTVTMPLTEDVDTYLALEAAQAAEAKLEEQADAGWTELASKMEDEGVTATVEGPPPEQNVEVEVLLQADVSADDSLTVTPTTTALNDRVTSARARPSPRRSRRRERHRGRRCDGRLPAGAAAGAADPADPAVAAAEPAAVAVAAAVGRRRRRRRRRRRQSPPSPPPPSAAPSPPPPWPTRRRRRRRPRRRRQGRRTPPRPRSSSRWRDDRGIGMTIFIGIIAAAVGGAAARALHRPLRLLLQEAPGEEDADGDGNDVRWDASRQGAAPTSSRCPHPAPPSTTGTRRSRAVDPRRGGAAAGSRRPRPTGMGSSMVTKKLTEYVTNMTCAGGVQDLQERRS